MTDAAVEKNEKNEMVDKRDPKVIASNPFDSVKSAGYIKTEADQPISKSPIGFRFDEFERVLDETRTSVKSLITKLAPVMGPEMDVAVDGHEKDSQQSDIANRLMINTDELQNLRNLVDETIARLEL